MPAPTTRRSGRVAALALIPALALTALAATAPISPAAAAAGDTYKYFASYESGSSLRIVGSSSSYQTRLYALTGQGRATSTSSYSVDFNGTPPSNNNNYTEADWDAQATPRAAAARGPVEWILKRSYPRVSTTVLRDTLRALPAYASFPSGYFSEGDAIAATQAAIWRFTDGVELDPASSTNSARTKLLYQYLVDNAATATATVGTAPTVSFAANDDRTAFAIEPGGAFGPFTLTASTATSITTTSAARIIDSQGALLTGAQPSGTQFWVQPTATPAAAGATTVTATTDPVTAVTVNVAKGAQQVSPYAARENLAVLSTATQSNNATLDVTWQIDRNSPGDFAETGGATTRSYTYQQRGELSPTLERVVFTDGTSTKTDLIGLTSTGAHRSADVYSASFGATALTGTQGPAVPDRSVFTEHDWSAAPALADSDAQGNVARILQRSYPTLTTAQFSEDLRAAGLLAPGSGNVSNWEAIAAAQAAIWHFTDGKDLDTTRYADPVSATAAASAPDSPAANVLDDDPATGWRAAAAGQSFIDFTFPASFEPRAYSVTSLAGGEANNRPTAWRLQRSIDGVTYTDVSTSSVTHAFSAGGETRRSGNIPPGASYGSSTTHYRLVFAGAADPAQPVEVGTVSFEGFGVFGAQPDYEYKQYANSTNVVLGYKLLLADATAHPVEAPAPSIAIESAATTFERAPSARLVGPFTLRGSSAAEVTVAAAAGSDPASDAAVGATAVGRAADAADLAPALVVDPSDAPTASLVLAPDTEFWVDPGDAPRSTLTLSARGSAVDWQTARALISPAGVTLTQLGVQSVTATSDLVITVAPAPVVGGNDLDGDDDNDGSGDTGSTPDGTTKPTGQPKPQDQAAQAPKPEQSQLAQGGLDWFVGAGGLAIACVLLAVGAVAVSSARPEARAARAGGAKRGGAEQ